MVYVTPKFTYQSRTHNVLIILQIELIYVFGFARHAEIIAVLSCHNPGRNVFTPPFWKCKISRKCHPREKETFVSTKDWNEGSKKEIN